MATVRQAEQSDKDLVEFVGAAEAAAARGAPLVVSAGDRTVTCSPDATAAVLGVLRLIGSGQPVHLVGLPEELSTGQAADLLGVSRPTVVALVDSGALPATRVRTHRRLRTTDVLAYKEHQENVRRKAFNDLVALSDELGLYDY